MARGTRLWENGLRLENWVSPGPPRGPLSGGWTPGQVRILSLVNGCASG